MDKYVFSKEVGHPGLKIALCKGYAQLETNVLCDSITNAGILFTAYIIIAYTIILTCQGNKNAVLESNS